MLSYSLEGKHFFGAHRDNGAPATADRAFAVSLNLNDDFEGGELVFPEYAGLKVSPPTGAAAVFSCSLLHRALPVTRGRRFVLTTSSEPSPHDARRCLLSCALALLAATDAAAQQVKAHMEACTEWGRSAASSAPATAATSRSASCS